MKITFSAALLCAALVAAIALPAFAQEQKAGQPLYFPKDEVKERPSDLHMGSDPGYKPDAYPPQGSDETGYPATIDPQQENVEEKVIYKRVDDYEKDVKPPSRWGD